MNTATSVRRGRSPAGFSMVELLVVVALIAIMATFSLPGIARYIRNYRIRGAANEVAGALQSARLKAITGNVNYGVLFVPINNETYRVVSEDVYGRTIGGARPDLSTLLAAPLVNQQAGPLQTLPRDVIFANAATGCPELSAAVPPFVPAGTLALRFDRLGAVCQPTAGPVTPPCPQVDAGAPFFWVRAATSDVAMCVREQRTGITRTVMIGPGGRVQVTERTTELNQ